MTTINNIDNDHVQAFLQRHAKPSENVVAWAAGYIGEMMGKGDKRQHNGVLIVTHERAVFYRKGWLGEVIESIPLKSITSIERKSLMGLCTLRLHASHDDLTFKLFDAGAEGALANAIEEGRAALATNAMLPASTPSPLEAIRQLGELHAAGVLTDEEFQSKKTALLARL